MKKEDSVRKDYRLWPPISPFREGFLQVSTIHRIRFALYGNPDGTPVFFLHGGPGAGCTDEDARWFDPEEYMIITHDQRGSGKSVPWAEIEDNTPQDLVEDLERLREHLNIADPVAIFAGSWGTTLALLYAEAYPGNVSTMILRGVFTCGWEDQDYFYSPEGAARFSPQAWERFIKKLPEGDDRIQERLHRLLEESDEEEKKKWCAVQSEYEYSFFTTSSMDSQWSQEDHDALFAEMRINSHYQANRFFLEDGQILNNAGSIAHIPVCIIQGTRDVICPPSFAFELHRRLPRSRLILVQRGEHLASDPPVEQALLEAVSRWDRSPA